MRASPLCCWCCHCAVYGLMWLGDEWRHAGVTSDCHWTLMCHILPCECVLLANTRTNHNFLRLVQYISHAWILAWMIDIACTICMQLDSCNYIDDAPTLNSIWYITFDEPHYIRANHITFEEPHYIHHIFHSVHYIRFPYI